MPCPGRAPGRAAAPPRPSLSGVLQDLIRQAADAQAPGTDLGILCANLARAGAGDPVDFSSIDAESARVVWEPLAACSHGFLGRFLELCNNHASLLQRAQREQAGRFRPRRRLSGVSEAWLPWLS